MSVSLSLDDGGMAFGPPRRSGRLKTDEPAAAVHVPVVGEHVWLWQDVDGWVSATVEARSRQAPGDDTRWKITLKTEFKYAGSNLEEVTPHGDDTVVFAPLGQRPALPPSSVLPKPVTNQRGEKRTMDDLTAEIILMRGRFDMSLKRFDDAKHLVGGVDFAVRTVQSGGLGKEPEMGVFALLDLSAGSPVTRYWGEVHDQIDFKRAALYQGDDATFNRGTHLKIVPGTDYVIDGWPMALAARERASAGEAPVTAHEYALGVAAFMNSSHGDSGGRNHNCKFVWVANGELWVMTTRAVQAGEELLLNYNWDAHK